MLVQGQNIHIKSPPQQAFVEQLLCSCPQRVYSLVGERYIEDRNLVIYIQPGGVVSSLRAITESGWHGGAQEAP